MRKDEAHAKLLALRSRLEAEVEAIRNQIVGVQTAIDIIAGKRS